MVIFVSAVAVVLVVSFLCSIYESVLLSITRPQIELLTNKGGRAGALLAGFKDNMDVPIAAILILNTAAHTVGAAVAGASYANVFDPATLWLFSLIFTFAVLLFTEIIPKTLGVSYARQLAVPVAHGIRFLTVLLKPLVMLSERLSRMLRPKDAAPITSAEEIRLMAVLGRSEGAVSARTAGMVVGATHLRHLEVHDVMLPRNKVQFFSADMSRDQVLTLLRETGHSRFPYTPTGELNDVSGLILVKVLLDWLLTHPNDPIDWDGIKKEPLIVPASVPLQKMLSIYQDSRRHLAIVVNEYGSVEGIATMEDILEEIVGDILDESDQPSNDIQRLANGGLRVKAEVDLRRLAVELGVTWKPGSPVTTIGGLLSEKLERIPLIGDEIEWQGHVIKVLSADDKRANWVMVKNA